MRSLSIIVAVLAAVVLQGCATSRSSDEGEFSSYATMYERELVQSARDIRDSLRVLAETNNAKALREMTPEQVALAERNATYTPPGMGVPLTLDWNGPLTAAIQMIAEASNYEFRVLGKAPVPDTIVRLQAFRRPAIDMIRDAGTQAGAVADVRIFEGPRIVELQYNADRGAAQVAPADFSSF